MKAICAAFLFIVCTPAVISQDQQSNGNHTMCFNYFLQKDGCVYSSPSDNTRCAAPLKEHASPVYTFNLPPNFDNSDAEVNRLQRRYDTDEGSFPIASGTGICGPYDSETELGVCLWSGAEQTNPTPETAGWLNGPMPANCNKRVYIQRTGQPDTVQYAKVIDGCSFNAKTNDTGCFEIGLSIQLFNAFKPNATETKDQRIYGGITWDFDNLNGQDPAQGPV